MYKLSLVNMPFADLAMPSIALTQLKWVVESRLPGSVAVDLLYLNQDFADFVGLDTYQHVSGSMRALYAGLGDWFFRSIAFPDLPDNTAGYLRRFYWGQGPEIEQVKHLSAIKGSSLDAYLDGLITRYDLDHADMVGFTSMFMQNAACFAMARKLKRRNPQVVTVMGGANCEFPMGQVIAQQVKDIDFVFSGNALKSFPKLVECQLRGDGDLCQAIDGVFSIRTRVTSDSIKPIGEELDINTPLNLDYDEFLRTYAERFPSARFVPQLPVETSRGCWWGQRAHCTFCGLNGATMSYRSMKPDLAIRQFRSLFRWSEGPIIVHAVDNILPRSYLRDVLPHLETPSNVEIFYEVKADLTREEMQVLADARVRIIQPGIESLATSTLKLMKKGTTALQNVAFLKNCVTSRLKPTWNLLIGFPGERADVYRQYMQNLPLLTHLRPPSGVFPVRFDRFSPYHAEADRYGLDLHPMDFYEWIYPFDEVDLKDFAYYFSDRNVQAEYFNDLVEWIQPLRDLVARWQARWAGARAKGTTPRLHFSKSSSGVIYDSRGESPTEYSVGDLGRAFLLDMITPISIERVAEAFSARHGVDATETLNTLLDHGLVFKEGDRVLSLVFGGHANGEGVPRVH